MKSKRKKNETGITLIALIVTIIILIILATISTNLILEEGGLISKTQKAGEEYKIAQAREKLDIILGSAQAEKRLNKEYNENEFLDEFILKELPGTQIEEDIVIVDGYAFEIDRSVPRIGKYVGTEESLVFPDLNVVVKNAENRKTATITITAKEEVNGIRKIEVLQDGLVIKEYIYDNVKEEITEDYVVKQNRKYTIKVYAEHARSKKAEVSGLIEVVKYNPNGNKEYKKEHKVTITVNETIEKVKTIKYQWLQTAEEPEESSFSETCHNGDTITKNEVTGIWYLWTLVETESGKKDISRSEGFYFDNQGPEVELISTPVSETSFTLTATAHDNETKVVKYEFYVNGELKETIHIEEETTSYTVEEVSMGDIECYVIVTDMVGNKKKQEVTARTKMHVWERWETKSTIVYSVTKQTLKNEYWSETFPKDNLVIWSSITLNTRTGSFDAARKPNKSFMVYF